MAEAQLELEQQRLAAERDRLEIERNRPPIQEVIHNVSPNVSVEIEEVKVATPSKEELARQWLLSHKEDRKLGNRTLEKTVFPMGVTIGYQTWNRVKNDLKESDTQGDT